MIHTEVMKYKAGLACAPMHFFKVTYNKHILALDDLSTLDDQNWVNDQVGYESVQLELLIAQETCHCNVYVGLCCRS